MAQRIMELTVDNILKTLLQIRHVWRLQNWKN